MGRSSASETVRGGPRILEPSCTSPHPKMNLSALDLLELRVLTRDAKPLALSEVKKCSFNYHETFFVKSWA